MNQPILEQALKAFTYHRPVTLHKKDATILSDVYVLIIYGDFACRIQSTNTPTQSQFITFLDIEEIAFAELELQPLY